MEDKSKFDELLISYLLNELDAEDEKFVVEWIDFSEQNRQYFEELSAIWKLTTLRGNTANIDVNDEWTYFKEEGNAKAYAAA